MFACSCVWELGADAGLPKTDLVIGAEGGRRYDFVVCTEMVEVTEDMTKREDVVERLEVETEMRTMCSTVSVDGSSSFSCGSRGVVLYFALWELEGTGGGGRVKPRVRRGGVSVEPMQRDYPVEPCQLVVRRVEHIHTLNITHV